LKSFISVAVAMMGAVLVACGPATPASPPFAVVTTPLKDSFPGAEGYGRISVGGRGGRVVAVTTLDDSGPGSLRACIDMTGPRICVFRVAGVIRFTTERPIIHNPYITIAGQTAPGGGIILTHGGGRDGYTPLVIKSTHDVIVQHIRVRPDLRGEKREANSAIIIEGSRRVMIDHVSTSWSLDENIGGYAANDEVTISNSIFAEGIPRHDKCALLASDPVGPQKLSFIRNLCAHNGDRNPDINFPPGSCVEVVNNVLYNGMFEFAEIWESYGGTPVTIVGNYFRAGPDTVAGQAHGLVSQSVGSKGAAQLYEEGNLFDGLAKENQRIASVRISNPPCPLTVKPSSAQQAYATVLAGSGAMPRDSLDRRIIADVVARTGHIVKAAGQLPELDPGVPYPDADGDGMADDWENAHGLNPHRFDAWGDRNGDGWTNLDEFLDARSTALIAQR